jgi:hypothetical protein
MNPIRCDSFQGKHGSRGTLAWSKAKAVRPFSFPACSVRDTACQVARTCRGSGDGNRLSGARTGRNICAPIGSRMRRHHARNSIVAAQPFLVLKYFGVSPATADWHRCHQTGDSSCKARTGLPPLPLKSSPEEPRLGKSPSAENCGPHEELAAGFPSSRNR